MTKLEKLYSIIENSREVGVKLNKEVLQQVEELEEGIIKEEILPALGRDIAPRLDPIKRDLVLVVEYHPGEPISVALSRKKNITELLDAKPLEIDPEVEHKELGPRKNKAGKIAPKTGLCIYRKDKSVLQEHDAATTFTAAIVEAGLVKVRELGLKFCRVNLVSTSKDKKYGHAQREAAPGLYVLTHSSTKDKKKMLDKINDALKMGWTIEIVK